MGRRALKIAEAYGGVLPRFASLREAKRALFAERDRALVHLQALAAKAEVSLDRTPQSLRALEQWYFALHSSRGFKRLDTSRKAFEEAMAYYVGAVAAKHAPAARWIVESYAFAQGRYEIGVATGIKKVMLGGMCRNWYKELRNLKHDKLSREYRDFFVPYKVPVRAKLPSDDASLEREIERQLHLKSEPLIYPGKLKSSLRYSLHDDRISGGRIERVLQAMLARGTIEKVPLVRKAGFRYRAIKS